MLHCHLDGSTKKTGPCIGQSSIGDCLNGTMDVDIVNNKDVQHCREKFRFETDKFKFKASNFFKFPIHRYFPCCDLLANKTK